MKKERRMQLARTSLFYLFRSRINQPPNSDHNPDTKLIHQP